VRYLNRSPFILAPGFSGLPFTPTRLGQIKPPLEESGIAMIVQQDVGHLRTALGTLPPRVINPVLIVMTGLPGTGKSTFARLLAKRLPLVIVETDSLRTSLVLHPHYTRGENSRLFTACHKLIFELLDDGISVLFDATNLSKKNRSPLYEIAGTTNTKLILVRTTAPQHVVYARLYNRSHSQIHAQQLADWNVYRRMRSGVKPISENHVIVNTSKDIESALEIMVDKISRLLEDDGS